MNRRLGRFLVRRLLLMIPTFFGVTLITFGLLQVMPGEPNQQERLNPRYAPTKAQIAENRRLLGLDQPLFLNLEPRQLAGTLRRVLADRDDLLARDLGTALLPHLALALRDGRQKERAGVVARAIIKAQRPLLRSSGPPTLEAFLRDHSAARLAQWVAKLPGGTAKDALIAAGTLANGPLIDALSRDRTRTRAICDVLGRINRHAYWRASEFHTAEKQAGARLRWIGWHERFQTWFRGLSTWDRVVATIAETQYIGWLGRIVRVDFGYSLTERVPVGALIRRHFPVTAALGSVALLLAFLGGVPLGVWTAQHEHRLRGKLAAALTILLFALPSYWLGTVLIQLLCGSLRWFPAIGLHGMDADQLSGMDYLTDLLQHAILPTIVLSYGVLVVVGRYMASEMQVTLREPFIRTARAKGCSTARVIWLHALQNSLVTVISLLGMLIPSIIAGSIVVEKLFDIPGMGLLTLRAIVEHDYPTVMAVVTFSAVATMFGLLVSDLLYAVADPRVAEVEP